MPLSSLLAFLELLSLEFLGYNQKNNSILESANTFIAQEWEFLIALPTNAWADVQMQDHVDDIQL